MKVTVWREMKAWNDRGKHKTSALHPSGVLHPAWQMNGQLKSCKSDIHLREPTHESLLDRRSLPSCHAALKARLCHGYTQNVKSLTAHGYHEGALRTTGSPMGATLCSRMYAVSDNVGFNQRHPRQRLPYPRKHKALECGKHA